MTDGKCEERSDTIYTPSSWPPRCSTPRAAFMCCEALPRPRHVRLHLVRYIIENAGVSFPVVACRNTPSHERVSRWTLTP